MREFFRLFFGTAKQIRKMKKSGDDDEQIAKTIVHQFVDGKNLSLDSDQKKLIEELKNGRS